MKSSIYERIRAFAHGFAAFEVDTHISRWWRNESASAKVSFVVALTLGFISHLFVYTGRYYGHDDMGIIMSGIGPVDTGRWFNGRIIVNITNGFVLPLVYGLMIALFLAASAFFVCKMFDIKRKWNAALIGLLLSTFPSIANTNLFLYESAGYHLAVLLAVLAVYMTVRHGWGFIIGAILSVLVLATYQSKYNIVVTLALMFLLVRLLGEDFNVKAFMGHAVKLSAMILLGAFSYALSVPVFLRYYGRTFNNYRGFSAESIQNRLFSVAGINNAMESTYRNFREGFFGNMYFNTNELRLIYILIATLALLFLLMIIIKEKIYRQYGRLLVILLILLLLPLASNLSNFFDIGNAYGLMIYAFVFTPVFAMVLSERCSNALPVLKSILTVCMVIVVMNYIVGNNIYYLRAHYVNQRTYSLTVRVLDRIEPLLPLTTSNRVTVFGTLPNEYALAGADFGAAENIRDGAALPRSIFLNHAFGPTTDTPIRQFGDNINNNHGVYLWMLRNGSARDSILEEIMANGMPAWPAEDSVAIIDDVVVVNFGMADVVFESDADGPFFRARHWVSEGHALHTYEYHWQIYKNGEYVDGFDSASDRLYWDASMSDGRYRITVRVRNADVDFSYPEAAIIWPAD